MGDNQSLKSYLAAALMNGERYAPTITRFIADHFSELVPPPDYFTRLVRDILNCYDESEPATAPTKPEEVLARLPAEFTRADAVRVGEEFGVTSHTVERHLVI